TEAELISEGDTFLLIKLSLESNDENSPITIEGYVKKEDITYTENNVPENEEDEKDASQNNSNNNQVNNEVNKEENNNSVVNGNDEEENESNSVINNNNNASSNFNNSNKNNNDENNNSKLVEQSPKTLMAFSVPKNQPKLKGVAKKSPT